MSEITLAIAFLSAGIALSMGMVSLFIGLHKNGQRVDLVFGALCILMFLFFVIAAASRREATEGSARKIQSRGFPPPLS